MTLLGNTAESLSFLRRWPAATLQLTAIHILPEGHHDADGKLDEYEKGLIESRAFDKDVDLDHGGPVERWINERQGRANLYYSVNTLLGPKNSKALKRDVKEVIALHVDIDVPPGEAQETTAAALVDKVRSYRLDPSVIINSGGGVQAFWILQEADRIPIDGDVAAAERAECYTRQLEADFGADHCHNVDRIMRLPGSWNIPDKKKRDKGRQPALAKLVEEFPASPLQYNLSAFTAAPSKGAPSGLQPAALAQCPGFKPGTMPPREPQLDWEEVQRITDSGEFASVDSLREREVAEHALLSLQYGDNVQRLHEQHVAIGHRVSEGKFGNYSDVLMAIATALLRAGLTNEEAAAVLRNSTFPGTKHVQRQTDPAKRKRAAMRAIGKAGQDIFVEAERERAARAGIPEWAETVNNSGLIPYPTMRNARIAMEAVGIKFAKDVFHNRVIGIYNGDSQTLKPLIGELSDDVLVRSRDIVIAAFNFDAGEKSIYDAVRGMAIANSFDPVLDMFEEAERLWVEDGKQPRIDKAAHTYWGAEDTPLNCAFMSNHLKATAKRAWCPGVKYDDCLVQEGPQGGGKSTSIEIVAGTENFSSQKILGINEKQQAEQVRGTLCYEIAELAGMMRAETEDTKSFFSRTHDKVRAAYGKVVEEVPRRNTFWGSSNDDQYLQDQTGNRRYLPLRVGRIDLEALRRDRLLLLGEASWRVRHGGESWTTPEDLWPTAQEAQEARRLGHPWEDELRLVQGTFVGDRAVVHTSHLLTSVLGLHKDQQTDAALKRVNGIMKRLGWERSNNGLVRIKGVQRSGFFRSAQSVIGASDAPERQRQATRGLQPRADAQGGTDEIPF